MNGYIYQANPCAAVGTDGCEEVHGCALDSYGNFVDGSDVIKCSEKHVETPQKDNEYTLHTIRSSSQCNGRLDIQLRQRSPVMSITNLLMDTNVDSNILRPVYDVRLPCSRITAKTSDTLKITFHFDAQYDLAQNRYVFTVGANDDMDSDSDGTWSKTYSDGLSGFTKVIAATPFVGECGAHSSQSIIGNIATGYGTCDQGFTNNNCNSDYCKSSKIEDANNCLTLGVDGDQLTRTFKLAMIYTRTFKYSVSRAHNLDPLINDTVTTETTYFCQDQQFSVSVDRNKQASVRVTTPIQIIMERKAQIQEITWSTEGCQGANMYKLYVKVHLSEQNVQTPNELGDFQALPSDFSVSPVSSSDSLTEEKLFEGGNSYIVLTSSCIEVTLDDCSLANDSPFKDLTQTRTEVLVTADDSNLGDFATGVEVISNVVVDTNFVTCPLDNTIEETGELEVDLSFQALNDGTDVCLEEVVGTATDPGSLVIDNCKSAFGNFSRDTQIYTLMLIRMDRVNMNKVRCDQQQMNSKLILQRGR